MSTFRNIILVLFLIAGQVSPAQKHAPALRSFALQLTEGMSADQEKADTIFRWITDNIAYDFKMLERGKYPDFGINVRLSHEAYMKAYNDAVAFMVLKHRKGICDGYARLFKSLCDYAGVEAVYIPGTAKTVGDVTGRHAWNAVRIDSAWHLLDPTWASGYGDQNKFYKAFEPYYYLTAPEKMILDHLPDDAAWTLLDSAVTLEDFRNSPIRSSHFLRRGVADFHPKNKVLAGKEDIILTFELDSLGSKPDIMLSDRSGFTKHSNVLWIAPNILTGAMEVIPNYGLIIPKFVIVRLIETDNRLKIHLQSADRNWKVLQVYVNSAEPSIIYRIE